MSPATNVVPFRDSGSFDIDCIFGVEIGRDRSGNFALAFNGLAVRTPDDRFVVPRLYGETVRLFDASCLLTGVDPYVFRFPVVTVDTSDLIVTSDAPFSALFVIDKNDDGSINGVVPGTQQLVRYIPPENLFGQRFFVKVFSISNLFGGGGGDGPFAGGGGGGINPLFFLLCCCGKDGRQDNGLLTALLFSQLGGVNTFAAQGGGGAANFAPLLALLGSRGQGDLDPLLLLALGGGAGGAFFNPGGKQPGGFKDNVEPKYQAGTTEESRHAQGGGGQSGAADKGKTK